MCSRRLLIALTAFVGAAALGATLAIANERRRHVVKHNIIWTYWGHPQYTREALDSLESWRSVYPGHRIICLNDRNVHMYCPNVRVGTNIREIKDMVLKIHGGMWRDIGEIAHTSVTM